MAMEKRSLSLELRNNGPEDGKLKVSGVVNKPGEKSQLLYSNGRQFYEIVDKGVFENAIKEANEILFLDSHDRKKILSSTKNDSLTLSETEDGVEMEATIVDTSYGRDAYALMNSGLVSNMSFGFQCLKDAWTRDSEGVLIRNLKKIKLNEVSCIKSAAYEDSAIQTRGLDIGDVEIPDMEEEGRGIEPEVNLNKFDFKNENGEVIGSLEVREVTAAEGAPKGGSKAELFIYDQIGNSKWESWFGAVVPQQIVSMISGLRKFDNIDLRINSPGGSVFGGYAIANLLKTVPGRKVAYIDGICASIATVIAMACDEIVMPSNTIFMIHPPSCSCGGTAKDFEKQAKILNTIEEGLLDIYEGRAVEGVTRAQIKELVDEETYLSGTEAAKIFNITVTKPSTEARCLPVVKDEFRSFEKMTEIVDGELVIKDIIPMEGPKDNSIVEPKEEPKAQTTELSDEERSRYQAMLDKIIEKEGN